MWGASKDFEFIPKISQIAPTVKWPNFDLKKNELNDRLKDCFLVTNAVSFNQLNILNIGQPFFKSFISTIYKKIHC